MQSKQRKIIWNTCDLPESLSLDAFTSWAGTAAEHEATHVSVSRLPYSRWQLKDDRDPHPEWASWPIWSMINAGIFKIVVPDALAKWLPVDEAQGNLDILKERCAVLRGLGLKGAFYGNDPMWLPEGVYRAHPEWRGAQAELGRIAHLPYFSPCVAHPDVLRMYRDAVTVLCRELPEIDVYNFFTNDSCGGICWSTTYPGPNGPERCRHHSAIAHITGFLTALQQGAETAGTSVDVNIDYLRLLFDPDEAVYATLKPGQGINSRDAAGAPWQAGVLADNFVTDQTFPVTGIPKPTRYLAQIEAAWQSPAPRLIVGRVPHADALMTAIYRAFQDEPTSGPASRMALLRKIAAARVGDAHAETLLQAWIDIEEAAKHLAHVHVKGSFSITLTGPALMRWLLMPLVPDVERLTPEETTDFLRGRIVRTPQEADSYHAILGEPGIAGDVAVWMARHAVLDGVKCVGAALDKLESLAEHARDDAARQELDMLGLRLKAHRCVARTIVHFIDYQHTLTRADPKHTYLTWRRERMGHNDINQASLELRHIARAEADNVIELARLIESTDEPIISMARTAEEEDPFWFSPDLPRQLHRKYEIMMDHWPDYLELYPPMPMVKAKGEEENHGPACSA